MIRSLMRRYATGFNGSTEDGRWIPSLAALSSTHHDRFRHRRPLFTLQQSHHCSLLLDKTALTLHMSSYPSLKLTYFNTGRRADAIRLALNMAGVPFEDEQLSVAEFKDRRATLPYGKLPVLTVGDEMLAETQPIFRYIGRLTGMYPPASEPIASAVVDELLDSFEDLYIRIVTPTISEPDATKQKTLREETVKTTLPQALARIDKRLQAVKKSPFFVERPTTVFIHEVIASTYVSHIMDDFKTDVPEWFMDDYLAMQAACVKVSAHQSIRQPTEAQIQPIAKPQQVTLSYFDMPGRAEPIRLALHIGGISFKDERLSYDEYLERKPSLPNGNLPVLDVDGHMLAQSAAILRYVGTVTGLYPAQHAMQALKIDEVVSRISELFYSIDPWFAASGSQKSELGKKLAANEIKMSLSSLDKRIATWKAASPSEKSPFMLGETTMTIADIVIHTMIKFLQTDFVGENKVSTTITEPYTQLSQIHDAVAINPRVVEWATKRLPPMA